MMASPQKEKGHTPIANEILDEVLKRKFTKRQDRILNIIWRFSYGFNKKEAYFPEMKTFAMYGIVPQVIGTELLQLEGLGVIAVDWDTGIVKFNKDYELWQVPLNKAFDKNEHKHVMRLNLRPKERQKSGWNNSRRGGGRPVAGSQTDNQSRLMNCEPGLIKHEPTGYENNNLQVNEIITQPSDGVNDNKDAQAQKASRKQVGKSLASSSSNDVTTGIEQNDEGGNGGWSPVEDSEEDWITYIVDILKKPNEKFPDIGLVETATWLVKHNDLELLEECYDAFQQIPIAEVRSRIPFFMKIIEKRGGEVIR